MYPRSTPATLVQVTLTAAASTAVSAVDELETFNPVGANGAACAATGTNEEATKNRATNS
jgi:hypothetical protein